MSEVSDVDLAINSAFLAGSTVSALFQVRIYLSLSLSLSLTYYYYYLCYFLLLLFVCFYERGIRPAVASSLSSTVVL